MQLKGLKPNFEDARTWELKLPPPQEGDARHGRTAQDGHGHAVPYNVPMRKKRRRFRPHPIIYNWEAPHESA